MRSVAKLKLLMVALASGVTRLRKVLLISAGSCAAEGDSMAVVPVGEGASTAPSAGVCVETGRMGLTSGNAVGLSACTADVGRVSVVCMGVPFCQTPTRTTARIKSNVPATKEKRALLPYPLRDR